MNKRLYRLIFAALFVVFISACTTTSRTLSREVSTGSDSELTNAKIAFHKKKYVVAAELLKPLAEGGRGDAQYALGYLYFNGLGVTRNESLAVQWFNAAAANGNKNARQALLQIPSSRDSVVIDLRDKKESIPEPAQTVTDDPALNVNEPAEDSIFVKVESPTAESYVEPEPAELLTDPVLNVEPDPAQSLTNDPVLNVDKPVEDSTFFKVEAPTVESNADQKTKIEKNTDEISEDVVMPSDSEEPEGQPKLTDGEKWVVEQPGKNFTIQLISSTDESALQGFISDNNLQDMSHYYRTQKNGKLFYILVYGSFESYDAAKESLNGLSSRLKKKEPWIRNISDAQGSIPTR